MRRYCYIPTGNEVWFDVAVNLYNAGIAEPVLWNGDEGISNEQRKFLGRLLSAD